MAYNTSQPVSYSANQQPVNGLSPAVDSTEYQVFADGSVTPLAANQYDIAHIDNTVHITITDSTLSNSGPFLVKRRTDLQNLRNTFYPGTNIRSQDLNTNYTQALNAAQEVYDNYLDAERGVLQGTLDANNNRITNLATPTNDTDIVNKSYADGVRADVNAKHTEVQGWRNETEQFRDAAEVAKDFLQGKYLGSHATAPVDGNGAYINPYTNTALSATDNGAFYFNTTNDKVFIWEDGHPEGGWVVGIDPPIIPFSQNDNSNWNTYDNTVVTYAGGSYFPEIRINQATFVELFSLPAGCDRVLVTVNGELVPADAVIIEGDDVRINLLTGSGLPTLPTGVNAWSTNYAAAGITGHLGYMPSHLSSALVNAGTTPVRLSVIGFGEAVFGAAGWNAANYTDGVVSLTSYSNPELNIVTEDLRPQITNGSTTLSTTLSSASVTYTQVAGTNSYVASFVLPYVAPNGFSIDSTSYQPTITFTDGTSLTANFTMRPSYISGISIDSSTYHPTFTITKHDGSTSTITPPINIRGPAATLAIDTTVDIGDTPAVTNNSGSTENARDIRLTLPRTWHISSSDPSSSDGVDGQMAYNSSTAVVFGPKTGGSWGTGYQLNGWFISNGVPGANDGIDGQMAFDYANYAYYGPKSGGSWGSASYISVDPDIGVLAGIAGDIATLADIEDGTNATNAIQTVAGISTDVSAVSPITSDVTSVANIGSDVTTVAGLNTEVSNLGAISTEISNVDGVKTEIGIIGADNVLGAQLRSRIQQLALVTTEIENVSDVETEVEILGQDSNAGIQLRQDIGTVAGISSDVTTVGGKATEIGILGANTTAGSDLRTAIGTIGEDTATGNTLRTNINNVGSISTDVTDVAAIDSDVVTVANMSSTDINQVAYVHGQIPAVASVASDIPTVAGIANYIPTVYGQISPTNNLLTVANLSSNINTTVANINSINTVGSLSQSSIDLRSDLNSVANISSDVSAVAGQITPNNNIAAVVSQSSDISTVASQINPTNNISTVAGVSSDITIVSGLTSTIASVVSNEPNINTVAGQISPTNNISTVAGKATEITTVSGISSDVTSVANNSANITTVAGSNTAVNTVAGQISPTNNISTVAGKATEITNVSNVATEVGVLGAASASQLRSDISTIGGSASLQNEINAVAGISSDVTAVSNAAVAVLMCSGQISPTNNIGTVAGISADVSTVAGVAGSVSTVAANNANVSTVAGISSDVTTVAGSINAVDRYVDEYTISSTQPTGATGGDLWYDQNVNLLKYYDSSNWNPIVAGGTTYQFSTQSTTFGVGISFYDTLINPGNLDYFAEFKYMPPDSVTTDSGSSYQASQSFYISRQNATSGGSTIEFKSLFSRDSLDVVLNKVLQNTRYGTVNYSTIPMLLDTSDTLFQMNLGGPHAPKNITTSGTSISQFGTLFGNTYGSDIMYMDHPTGTNSSGVLIYVRVHTEHAQHWHQTVAFKVESNHTYIFDADYKYISANWIQTAWEYVENNDTSTDWGSGEDPNNTDINWIGGSAPTLAAGEWNYIHFWCDASSDSNDAAKPYACYLGSHP